MKYKPFLIGLALAVLTLSACDATEPDARSPLAGVWVGSLSFTPADTVQVTMDLRLDVEVQDDHLTGSGFLDQSIVITAPEFTSTLKTGGGGFSVSGEHRHPALSLQISVGEKAHVFEGRYDEVENQITGTLAVQGDEQYYEDGTHALTLTRESMR